MHNGFCYWWQVNIINHITILSKNSDDQGLCSDLGSSFYINTILYTFYPEKDMLFVGCI